MLYFEGVDSPQVLSGTGLKETLQSANTGLVQATQKGWGLSLWRRFLLVRSRAAHAICFGGPALMLITHKLELKGLSNFYQ